VFATNSATCLQAFWPSKFQLRSGSLLLFRTASLHASLTMSGLARETTIETPVRAGLFLACEDGNDDRAHTDCPCAKYLVGLWTVGISS